MKQSMVTTFCSLAIASTISISGESSADVSLHVRRIESGLDKMQHAIADQSAHSWVEGYRDAYDDLFDQSFRSDPARARLLERFHAEIARAGSVIGSRGAKVVAREDRVETAKPAALATLKDGLRICNGSLSPNGGAANLAELDRQAAEYTTRLEHAIRLDPDVAIARDGYVGPETGALANIAACELGLAFRRVALADSMPAIEPLLDGDRKTKTGCGFVEYELRSEQVGKHWGPWQASGNESYPRALACAQFPRRTKAPPAAVKAALLSGFASARGGAIYESYFDGDDHAVRAIDADRAVVDSVKVVSVRVYKRNTLLRETACREFDPAISCAASGEGATAIVAYEHAKFSLARAAARKQEGNVAQCERLIATARDEGREFDSYISNAAPKTDELRFKTTDGVLDRPALERNMAAQVRRAESLGDNGWCGR